MTIYTAIGARWWDWQELEKVGNMLIGSESKMGCGTEGAFCYGKTTSTPRGKGRLLNMLIPSSCEVMSSSGLPSSRKPVSTNIDVSAFSLIRRRATMHTYSQAINTSQIAVYNLDDEMHTRSFIPRALLPPPHFLPLLHPPHTPISLFDTLKQLRSGILTFSSARDIFPELLPIPATIECLLLDFKPQNSPDHFSVRFNYIRGEKKLVFFSFQLSEMWINWNFVCFGFALKLSRYLEFRVQRKNGVNMRKTVGEKKKRHGGFFGRRIMMNKYGRVRSRHKNQLLLRECEFFRKNNNKTCNSSFWMAHGVEVHWLQLKMPEKLKRSFSKINVELKNIYLGRAAKKLIQEDGARQAEFSHPLGSISLVISAHSTCGLAHYGVSHHSLASRSPFAIATKSCVQTLSPLFYFPSRVPRALSLSHFPFNPRLPSRSSHFQFPPRFPFPASGLLRLPLLDRDSLSLSPSSLLLHSLALFFFSQQRAIVGPADPETHPMSLSRLGLLWEYVQLFFQPLFFPMDTMLRTKWRMSCEDPRPNFKKWRLNQKFKRFGNHEKSSQMIDWYSEKLRGFSLRQTAMINHCFLYDVLRAKLFVICFS